MQKETESQRVDVETKATAPVMRPTEVGNTAANATGQRRQVVKRSLETNQAV